MAVPRLGDHLHPFDARDHELDGRPDQVVVVGHDDPNRDWRGAAAHGPVQFASQGRTAPDSSGAEMKEPCAYRQSQSRTSVHLSCETTPPAMAGMRSWAASSSPTAMPARSLSPCSPSTKSLLIFRWVKAISARCSSTIQL